MKKTLFTFILLLPLFFLDHALYAQDERDDTPLLNPDDGVSFLQKDSLYLINFRFRMQNRAELYSRSATDLNLGAVDARVRRLRLRLDGFLGSPRLAYYIQLSFSRGDQDFDETRIPNVVRDAMLFYFFSDELYIGFGQGKLPGNRQRVISSGQQQFAERSIVNAFFNIDRDFGLFSYYTKEAGSMTFALKGAVTTGEGRNQLMTNDGLAYTAKVEWLPFGTFLKVGDYSEADLERHPTPKLSLSAAYHYNSRAQRTRGQTGRFLFEERNLTSIIFDFVFKYSGLSVYGEYNERKTDNPITYELPVGSWLQIPDFNYVFAGKGINLQGGYLFTSNYEIAARYAVVNFADRVREFEEDQQMLSLGMSKYIRGHRVKVQSNVSYYVAERDWRLGNSGNRWSWMFQVELGI